MKRHVLLLISVFFSCCSMWGQEKNMAVRTNLLYDACLTPNVGVEMNIGNQFTIGVDGMAAWWGNESRNKYWRVWGGEVSGRWWFGRQAMSESFTGHHAGIYVGAATYDIKRKSDGTGAIAYPFSLYCGAEYGYSFRLADQLCLDLSIGLGHMGGKYKTYESLPVSSFTDDKHKVWMETRRRNWWGPTRAEVTLVRTFSFKGFGFMKKGGER